MQQCRFSCLTACQHAMTCTQRDGSTAHAMAASGSQEEKPQVGYLRALIFVAEGRRNTAENEGTEKGQIGNNSGVSWQLEGHRSWQRRLKSEGWEFSI